MADSEESKPTPPSGQVEVHIIKPKWVPPKVEDLTSGDEKSSASKSLVMGYLKQLGHAPTTAGITAEDLASALRSFQEFANIAVTGKYDEETLNKMAKPRCARADKNTRPSFVSWTEKWNKNDITYTFEQMTPDMTPFEIRRAIGDAFNCWAAVTPLSFKEVATGGDIIIRFITDGFDGPGGTLAWGFGTGPVHFDEAEAWGSSFNLAATALHEVGHSLGLGHSSVSNSTMNPWYGSTYFELHPDDLHGIHSKYGWREPRWRMAASPTDANHQTAKTTSIISSGNQFFKLLANGQVWQYTGPPFTGWNQIGSLQGAVQLEFDRGALYARTAVGAVLLYSGTGVAWTTIDLNPDTAEIAVGNGEVYLRHHNPGRNYAAIYHYRGIGAVPQWEQVDDSSRTRQIAVDSAGNLYQRHDNGSLWHYVGPGIKWELMSDHAGANFITGGLNNLYYTTADGWVWTTNSTGSAQALNNNPDTLRISARGEFLCQMNKDRSIWRFSGEPLRGWEILDNFGGSELVAVSESGDIYQSHLDGAIWRLGA